jgi:hypothetical protein
MNNSELQQFTSDDVKKYNNYMITSAKHRTPPYEWSEGIFQRFKPVSGEFPIGNNFFGDMTCVNNQTGRGYYANPCGYWDSTDKQFNEGTVHKNEKGMNGTLFPIGNTKSFDIMSTPNNRVVFGYARIGEEFRNR